MAGSGRKSGGSGVRRRWLVRGRGRRKACAGVAPPPFPPRAPWGETRRRGPAPGPLPRALSARLGHRYVGSKPGELPGGMGRAQWAGSAGEGGRGFPGTAPPRPRQAGGGVPGPQHPWPWGFSSQPSPSSSSGGGGSVDPPTLRCFPVLFFCLLGFLRLPSLAL